VAVPAIVAACSSFTADDPTPGHDAGGGVDASTTTTDGPASGVDAGLSFCDSLSPPAAFCADFDDGKALTAKFPSVEGDLQIVTTGAHGGKGSLRAVSSPTAGAFAKRFLGKALPKRQTLSFWVRVNSVNGGPKGATTVLRLSLTSGGPVAECNVELELSPKSAVLSVYASNSNADHYSLAGNPGPNRWFPVSLALDPKGGDKIVMHVKLDGTDALSPVDVKTNCPATVLSQRPELGIGSRGLPEDTEVLFDDVVLDGE
jgi:hypothetical protein